MLVLDRAVELVGWMEPEELEWLAKQAQLHSRIVEVGSYLGRTTRALGDNTPGWVMAFDDWKGPRDAKIGLEHNGKVVEVLSLAELFEREQCDLYKKFEENMQDLLDAGKVKVLRGDHSDVSCIPSEFLNGSKPDMVFIDGNHDYQDARRDILTWKQRLAEGGLICGHDINFPGVLQAVSEQFKQWDVIPFTCIWRALA